jgi:hypothetical protein
MKTVKMMVQFMVQAYAEADVPTKEEVMLGATPEVRLANAKTSHMFGIVAGDDVPEEAKTFAGQLVLNSLSVEHAKSVAKATQAVIDKRAETEQVTFVQPTGQA